MKGIVLISHGLHEHILKYHRVADELTRRGYAVYGGDHMGHGLSYGKKGLITDYKVLINDQVEQAKFVKLRHQSDLPFFILAHSMGTVVTMNSSTQLNAMGFDIRGILFSGCAVVAGPAAASPFGYEFLYPLAQTSFAVWLAGILSSINPTGAATPISLDALVNSEVEKDITRRDPRRYAGSFSTHICLTEIFSTLDTLNQTLSEVVHAWSLHLISNEYALCFLHCLSCRDVMNKTAFEFQKMNEVGQRNLSNIVCPALLLHGSNDTGNMIKSEAIRL